VKEENFDLILLDLHLPDGDGILFLNEIQSLTQMAQVPVLVLSGKTEVQTKIVVLNMGALDYIQKPFEPLELKARVDLHLRRRNSQEQSFEAFGLRLELDKMKAYILNNDNYLEISLTQTEFKMLNLFIRNSEVVLSRDQILDFAWGQGTHVNDRTVDAHLSTLRKKLGKEHGSISSIRGVGYRFTPKNIKDQKSA
jgi:DNA-binding response OmpR family regulator